MTIEYVLDTETTGLDPSAHRVIEIACVEIKNKIRTGNVFHTYINPQRDVPADAFRIHGISTSFLKDKRLFSDICDEFLNFIDGGSLVIHNAPFDMKFLNAELKRYGKDILSIPVVDTLTMARRKFPGSPASLDALCKRFSVESSHRTKHGALLDAELLVDVYLHLTGGNQSYMNFDSGQAKNADNNEGNVVLPSRKFEPSAEELAAHDELIKKLKDPIW